MNPPKPTTPGTPDWKPRKMSMDQARAEIDEAIRDSENTGYSPDEQEADDFLDAFETMRITGKETTVGRETAYPGDTNWHTKLDYEVSFPADTVAVWRGRPLEG